MYNQNFSAPMENMPSIKPQPVTGGPMPIRKKPPLANNPKLKPNFPGGGMGNNMRNPMLDAMNRRLSGGQ